MESGPQPRPGLVAVLAYLQSALALGGVVTLLLFFLVLSWTGNAQPWGSISDLFGGAFDLGLIAFMLATRWQHFIRENSRALTSWWVGLASGVIGLAGSSALVWTELVDPTRTSLLGGFGLALQSVGFLLLLAWCVLFGLALGRAGLPAALKWGVVGATVVGLPIWFAWLGRRLADPSGPT